MLIIKYKALLLKLALLVVVGYGYLTYMHDSANSVATKHIRTFNDDLLNYFHRRGVHQYDVDVAIFTNFSVIHNDLVATYEASNRPRSRWLQALPPTTRVATLEKSRATLLPLQQAIYQSRALLLDQSSKIVSKLAKFWLQPTTDESNAVIIRYDIIRNMYEAVDFFRDWGYDGMTPSAFLEALIRNDMVPNTVRDMAKKDACFPYARAATSKLVAVSIGTISLPDRDSVSGACD